MVFHRIYNVYFQIMEKLIRMLLDKPCKLEDAVKNLSLPDELRHPFCELLEKKKLSEFIDKNGNVNLTVFQQSKTGYEKKLGEYGLTKLEKQWLRTVSLDPRAKLFDVSFPELDDVEPLYYPDEIVFFDRPESSDPWTDEKYIRHFRTLYQSCGTPNILAVTWTARYHDGWLKNFDTTAWALCNPVRIEYDHLLDRMFVYANCKFEDDGKSHNEILKIPLRDILSCRPAIESDLPEIWKPCDLSLCENAVRLDEPEQERAELRKSKNGKKCTKNIIVSLHIRDFDGALARTLEVFAGYQRKNIVCQSEQDKLWIMDFYIDPTQDLNSLVDEMLFLGHNICVKKPEALRKKIANRYQMQQKLNDRIQSASIHSSVSQKPGKIQFESMRPFRVKVVVTRPNTEVRISLPRLTDEDFILYEADCDGDGIYEKTEMTGDLTHVYENPGTYVISMRGNIYWMLLRDGKHGELTIFEYKNYIPDADDYYFSEVCQWGDIPWRNMDDMFDGACMIRITARDAPDLSRTKSMECMFRNCIEMNDPLDHWDVSHIHAMDGMFQCALKFNQPLDKWNVSGVHSMNGMFAYARSFNQPLESWSVSNVVGMINMFRGSESFNQPLDSWDVSQVRIMDKMFHGAVSFRQNLDSWNVSRLESSKDMFAGAVNMEKLPKWRQNNGL